MQEYSAALEYHRSLSAVSEAIAHEICNNSQACKPLDLLETDLDPILKNFPYTINSTPTVVSQEKVKELADTTNDAAALVRKMLKVTFDDQANRIADFYGVKNNENLVKALNMDIIPHTICRSDVIHGPTGYKILELNVTSNLGGWQPPLYEGLYRNNTAFSPYIGSTSKITLTSVLGQYIKSLVCSSKREGKTTRLLMFIDDPLWHERIENLYRAIFSSASKEECVEFIFVSTPEGIEFRDNKMFVQGRRVHAIVRKGNSAMETEIHQQMVNCFVHGNIVLPDNPLSELFSDKRSLALLYGLKDHPAFTVQERKFINEYVPWTVTSGVEQVTYDNKQMSLRELLTHHKDQLVVKEATGSQGKQVYIGRYSAPDKWQTLIEELQTKKNYVIQQFHGSYEMLAADGNQGVEVFEAVWGVFSFAGKYGGISLRMMPRSSPGVINSAQGAMVAPVFEQI